MGSECTSQDDLTSCEGIHSQWRPIKWVRLLGIKLREKEEHFMLKHSYLRPSIHTELLNSTQVHFDLQITGLQLDVFSAFKKGKICIKYGERKWKFFLPFLMQIGFEFLAFSQQNEISLNDVFGESMDGFLCRLCSFVLLAKKTRGYLRALRRTALNVAIYLHQILTSTIADSAY